ncbi:nitrogenase iron-molybdenum cofactor biosynthesis protein NifN [Azospirillum sp. RWY-5-1]|uniref:Nitrogenase iron-molybdenum cofactor biosynthesis protein NifN n=1 Tax=Azospirillum oleiclasticum TaxID=2735135 RepID=A0ABX2T745_9PROT|nr:nitrogenase iron-molybdenum cofactor biosynthesis protein NifN [Azospirillum oleiclasticum]NYZ13230.1 nitrogenase iron-molybdenum cofactor biosynthesis protein NifN [Azospirillum oleiclasticum]NYZ20098.1 nitrogenase iron-molybdenum cofactor biosynthesis protein NifN [Azospirillum oleiclasticum]
MSHIQRFPTTAKACSVNPLKMSQPLGGALAFLGIDNCLPLFHGSQGCTAFGLVLLVRHFREAIPLQTTAMDQVATILGGYENLEEAIRNIDERMKPALIGVCTTGVTETKGEDMAGAYATFRQRNPKLDPLNLVFVNTPDFAGGFEDGFAAAVTGIVETLAQPVPLTVKGQVNILAGCHLTPGDVEELREIVESFGLNPIILPDLSLSMCGRQPTDFAPTSLGGTTIEQIKAMGASEITLAIGEHMRVAAAALELKTDVPTAFFDRLTGLEASDRFIRTLSEISGRPVPARLRRQRESLVDGMLDGHFFFSRKRIAVALEPDLLYAVTGFLNDMGADVVAAVSPTQAPVLEKIRARTVLVGDHSDVEALASGADLIVSNSHGRQGAARLGVPLHRMGLPMFDRLGAGLTVNVGYRGTRETLFAIGNRFLAAEMDHDAHGHDHTDGDEHHHQDGGCGGGSCGCSAG